jgi:hypothetical protein
MKKNTILIAILIAVFVLPAKAQQIVNVSQKNNDIVVEYDLPAAADFVRLYVSLDGGKTYRNSPLKEVSGDLNNVSAGFSRSITWDILKEFETDAFESDQMRFKLEVKWKERWYRETFVTLNGAYSFMPQASFGFTVGQVKHFGWFVSVMSNGDFSGFDYAKECDNNGFITGGYLPAYTGERSKMRLSVMAGGMMRISGPLCARIGVGYGNRTMRWQVVDGTWNRNIGSSFEGIDLSAGLQLNLKGFVMSLEAVTTQFQTIEGKLGLGLAF